MSPRKTPPRWLPRAGGWIMDPSTRPKHRGNGDQVRREDSQPVIEVVEESGQPAPAEKVNGEHAE